MNDTTLITTYFALFVAGLAASLHCIGMCGPIIVGFTQVFEQTRLTVNGNSLDSTAPAVGRWQMVYDLAGYHLGRIWTYAMLGLVTGLAGSTIRQSAAFAGLQTTAAIIISVIVIVTGLVMLNVIPFFKLDSIMTGCAFEKFGHAMWFKSLIHSRGFMAKVLLGVIMGFLPCGLVYMMLATTLALPTPVHSALGMVVFGLGTLPSLTAAVIALKLVPVKWRSHSTRVAAILVIVVGGWMMVRAVSGGEHCHGSESTNVSTVHFQAEAVEQPCDKCQTHQTE